MQTNPRPFLLERYFGIHEFTAKVLLSSSDVESLSVREVLEMSAGDAEAMALWNDLSLGYTESQGHPLLLREIAATYGPNIDASHILEIAPEEGIFIAMSALVAAGDNVVVTWPAYQSLFEVAQARGATIRKWNAVDGRRFDLDDLDAQIAACGGSVKLIIVNFPHNPTGATLTVDEQARLVETAKRAGAFLFSDEMYRGLEHGDAPPLPAACELYEKAVSLSGLSKTYACPGLRVGWLACRDAAFNETVRNLKDYTTICGSAPSEILAIMVLRQRAAVIARSKKFVAEGLAALGEFCAAHADKLEYTPPGAGPVAYVKLKGGGRRGGGLSAEDAQRYSEELVATTGVMVVTSHSFEHEGAYVRLGVAKRGFGERLAAWGATFGEVPLPD